MKLTLSFKTGLMLVGLASASVLPAVQNAEVAAQERQKPPSRIRMDSNVMAAQLIKKVPPAYPSKAKEERRQGTVTLQVVILKDGTVGTLDAMPGADSDLTASALDAVQQWIYNPTLLNGIAVEVETTVQVNYTLTK